jgi:hypothetical protein
MDKVQDSDSLHGFESVVISSRYKDVSGSSEDEEEEEAEGVIVSKDEDISDDSPSPFGTPEPPPKPQRSFLSSLNLMVREATIDLTEDWDKNTEERLELDPRLSTLPAQTFRLDIKGLSVSHIVKTWQLIDSNPTGPTVPVSYCTMNCDDLIFSEFSVPLLPLSNLVANSQKDVVGKRMPILCRVLEDSEKPGDGDGVAHAFVSMRVLPTSQLPIPGSLKKSSTFVKTFCKVVMV